MEVEAHCGNVKFQEHLKYTIFKITHWCGQLYNLENIYIRQMFLKPGVRLDRVFIKHVI